MKIFVVGGAIHYANFIKNAELINSIEDADVVLFTGGEDVTPSVYGCKKYKNTYCNPARDKEEKIIFNKIKPNQICLGICRGSQFLCSVNGGILVQDCDGHALWGTHGITNGKMKYQITSTHHQMQYPFTLDERDYDILFTAERLMSGRYMGDKIEYDPIIRKGEPEIVLYHKEGLPKCLAVQGHPEMIPDSPVAEMISDLINDLVNARP